MGTFSEAAEDAIIEICEKHEKDNCERRVYRACISTNDYFIKFGDYKTLWPEIQTHRYVSAFAESLADTSKPRISKVLHHFERKERGYLVLEKIELSHSPPDLPKRPLRGWRRFQRLKGMCLAHWGAVSSATASSRTISPLFTSGPYET